MCERTLIWMESWPPTTFAFSPENIAFFAFFVSYRMQEWTPDGNLEAGRSHLNGVNSMIVIVSTIVVIIIDVVVVIVLASLSSLL